MTEQTIFFDYNRVIKKFEKTDRSSTESSVHIWSGYNSWVLLHLSSMQSSSLTVFVQDNHTCTNLWFLIIAERRVLIQASCPLNKYPSSGAGLAAVRFLGLPHTESSISSINKELLSTCITKSHTSSPIDFTHIILVCNGVCWAWQIKKMWIWI